MAEPPSSPPSEAAGAEDALSWYKAQYELLESELAEFRESSRELEQELEKDIERAEKQERILKEKADALRFEVEEWKVSWMRSFFKTLNRLAGDLDEPTPPFNYACDALNISVTVANFLFSS
jgi:hypothetical protein